MLPEYVNPDNINPHWKDPEAFGLDPKADFFKKDSK